MAALTENRNTPSRTGDSVQLTVKDAVVIYAGALVSVDANGEAVAASDTAAEVVVGRAAQMVDNADDGEVVDVDRGVFRLENGGTFTQADIGALAYVVDDQTAGKAGDVTNSIIAGRVVDVDSDGVWVDTRVRI